MIENNAIFCHRYLSLSERKYRKLSGFCRRSAVPVGLMSELAHLRKVPLRKLIKQLGLKPVPHD
jgi:hypothetical protein